MKTRLTLALLVVSLLAHCASNATEDDSTLLLFMLAAGGGGGGSSTNTSSCASASITPASSGSVTVNGTSASGSVVSSAVNLYTFTVSSLAACRTENPGHATGCI